MVSREAIASKNRVNPKNEDATKNRDVPKMKKSPKIKMNVITFVWVMLPLKRLSHTTVISY